MRHRVMVVMAGLTLLGLGYKSAPKQTVLPAPAGTNATAARHNDEGVRTYQQSQYERAKQQFEAAVAASPELAEAHYNLGMVLYRPGALREGDAHFIEAANLAPGDKVIWSSPPLKSVTVSDKEATVPASDGHS